MKYKGCKSSLKITIETNDNCSIIIIEQFFYNFYLFALNVFKFEETYKTDSFDCKLYWFLILVFSIKNVWHNQPGRMLPC